MSTGLLEQRANYPHTGYEYGYGSTGNSDADGNGRKEIDCSHLLTKMLTGAGYTIPYKTTRELASDTTHYDFIALNDVQEGDIALWTTKGHTGVVEKMEATRTKGEFFGSQTSTGPKSAKFGAGAYWPMPDKYLRPKAQYRSGEQPAPAPAPAPAGPVPLMTFQYPFRKADGKQFIDAEEVYKALEGETSGHYLLGSNNFWHGGIHISDKSAPQCVLNEPVRCMADGEVVAYRLNEDYLESTFGDNEKKLKYSNSFCLVRHEYKSQPNPETGPNKDKQNKLTFYSLYMHLLPYQRYPLASDETPTPKVTMTVGDFKAYDAAPATGMASESCGTLAKGTRLEVLETAMNGDVTYAKGKILSGSVNQGSVKKRSEGAEVWFAYLKNGEPYKNSQPIQIWVADKIPERVRPNYWQGKVRAQTLKKLDMYGDPAVAENGKPVGASVALSQLNPGGVIEFDSKEVLNLNVAGVTRRMAKCTNVSAVLAGAGTIPPSFWVFVENAADYHMLDWTSLTPSSFDSVQTAGTGIKAGDPIGYLGKTENLTGEDGGVSSKYQVHIEIFTDEAEVKDFLKNTTGLKKGKQYLHLAVGAALKKKAAATETTSVKKQHAVDLSKAPVIKEGAEDWYEVSVTEDGQSVTGLVKKASAVIITQHDWEKLGFQIVEENNATADGFLDPEGMPPFFKELFAKVDTNHDGDVSPGELTEALKNADTRDQWAKLIAHHPTEWKYKADAAKWSRLDKLLETSPKTLKHEKERISKYVFWEALTGKASMSTDVVWHFHPIEFLKNISAKSGFLFTLEMIRKIYPSVDASRQSELQEVADELNAHINFFRLDTPLRRSHFFAQVMQETGASLSVEEGFLWKASALIGSFSYFRNNPAAARAHGYDTTKPIKADGTRVNQADYEAVANGAYGGRAELGNGDFASGDGWKYRGRGLKQLTGRANYRTFTTWYKANSSEWPGEDHDFEESPDLLIQIKYAVRSAAYFWVGNRLHLRADAGATDATVESITDIVNKKTNSRKARVDNFKLIWNEGYFK